MSVIKPLKNIRTGMQDKIYVNYGRFRRKKISENRIERPGMGGYFLSDGWVGGSRFLRRLTG